MPGKTVESRPVSATARALQLCVTECLFRDGIRVILVTLRARVPVSRTWAGATASEVAASCSTGEVRCEAGPGQLARWPVSVMS